MTRSDHLRLTVICATWLGDGKSGNTCTLICLNELGYERLGMFSQYIILVGTGRPSSQLLDLGRSSPLEIASNGILPVNRL